MIIRFLRLIILHDDGLSKLRNAFRGQVRL
jgi:hypothetical protein